MAFCGNCGNNLGSDAFCTRCGTPAGGPVLPPPVSEETVRRPLPPRQTPPAGQPLPRPIQQPGPEATPEATPPTVQRSPEGQPPPDQPTKPEGSRWTAGRMLFATGFLVGLGACGFLLTYFLSPLWHEDNTIPPPAPALAASSSQSETAAPAEGTDEGTAWAKLQRIAAQDRAALQGTQRWRAQLASSPATESAVDFLASYEEWIQKEPDALLAWSGDWPHSYAPTSRHSWVILSNFTKATTRPIIKWCVKGNRGCWAKRLSALGEPADNTDHPPADPSKN